MEENFVCTKKYTCGDYIIEHKIFDVGLAKKNDTDEVLLHHFTSTDGKEYSAIYVNETEVFSVLRESEQNMITEWNAISYELV